ncbi:MAG: tetratricopeptide repeat protein [Bdellovibrionales bacterium]
MRRKLEAAFADFQANRIGDAAQAYRQIVEEDPDQPQALHMLGIIAFRMGRTDLALQLYDEAIRAEPAFALAWSNRALILRMLGHAEDALQSGRQAIACNPDLADGWDITGLLLRERRENEAAIQHHARAQTLNPRNPHIQNNYAVALASTGRLEEACHAAQQALALDPGFAVAHLTLANVLNDAGWPHRAVEHCRKAAALDPSLAEAVMGEGRALLLMGDFEAGWPKLELRKYNAERFAAMPRWQGEKVRHLILYAEQGVGDIVQFLRYIPRIRDRYEKLTLEVPASMRRFMAAQFPEACILSPDDPLPAADAHGLLMSLPYLFRTTIFSVPASIPYVCAEEAWRRPWRERLAGLPRPHIGLVWMGNPLYANDQNRSLRSDDVGPLLSAAGPHLVSMQKGTVTAASLQMNVYDAEPALGDFADTTGLIAELDLVISADTATAHFAGALGKPVWTLLPFTPDWRWMLGREDTPWYPAMRLFRQNRPKDWPQVVTRVTAEVRRYIGGNAAALAPAPWDGKILRQNPNAIPLFSDHAVMTDPVGAKGAATGCG